MRVSVARPPREVFPMDEPFGTPRFRAVPLDTAALRSQAATLYREVFEYGADEIGLSPRLLRGLLANGGSAVGALDEDDALAGFSYGFPGTEDGVSFHYSQATAVLGRYQGRGVGRLLKEAQAEVARAAGATSMRWAFDPANTRNAHFNLDTLGAAGRWFHRDFYDEPATDRLIVDWPLLAADRPTGSERAAQAAALTAIAEDSAPGLGTGTQDGFVWLRLPATLPSSPDEQQRIRTRVREACEAALGAGASAVTCRRIPGSADAAYLFAGSRR